MKKTLFVSLALAGVAGSATILPAQIIQPVRRLGPTAFVSLGAGWMLTNAFCDPASAACWNFGGALQYRGSLEYPLGREGGVGLAATTSRAPLYWAGNGPAPNQCSGCDADANITQILGTMHLGGGSMGFHQALDLDAGATMFSNFRTTAGAPLGPGKMVVDPTFGLGYGIGYSFTPRTEITITQAWDLIVHKRQSGSPNNTAQQQTTRVGFRMGLGGR